MTLDAKLLELLYGAGSFPVPLDRLAVELGVSQKVVLHRVDELRRDGFHIEDHPDRGFRIDRSPDRLIADDLQARLRFRATESGEALKIGNRIVVFEETASTNEVVQAWGMQGHPPGLVVMAELQSRGRGRHGRNWHSPARKGLWLSVLVESLLAPELMSRYTIMAAVAVAESLHRSTQLPIRIKWPNDILCRGRKMGGILLEWVSGKMGLVTMGIGINVNLEEEDLGPELRRRATSLLLEAGRRFHRPVLVEDLLWTLNRFHDSRMANDFPFYLEKWLQRDDTLGRQVRVLRTDGSVFMGSASQLDADGALLVRKDDGSIERILAGEVTLAGDLR